MKLLTLALIIWGALYLFLPKDDTDSPSSRSGMSLYTDNLTGCQYLGKGFLSSLTPRMDSNGSQIGCKK